MNLPIKLLYNLLFDMNHSQKEMVKIEDALAIAILEEDAKESLFHIEDIGESEMECWRIEAWKESLPRRQQIKEASNRRVYLSELKHSARKFLIRAIKKTSGLAIEDCERFANALITKKDWRKCKVFGVDVEVEKWKDLKEI